MLPIVVLLAGILGTMVLVRSRPAVVTEEPEVIVPLVRVVSVRPRPVSLDVTALGTVLPRTETTLAAQVAAEVVEVSPSFEIGGFFQQHEVLVGLDPRDFQLAIERAGARVAQARLRLTREQAEARVAAEEWRQLGRDQPDPLTLREPQQVEARAVLAAAEAELSQARLELERTRIRAPFTGRIRKKMTDLGQYLTPGREVATIHAIDFAEVQLPVPDHQLAFLDLPLTFRGGLTPGPEAVLSANFSGRRYTWHGRIVRTEGEIDRRSRMIHLVARVEDPYGRGDDPSGRPPLAVGLFVEARIAGRAVDRALVLPRGALRGEDQVLVVDSEERLRYRTVELLQIQGEQAIISGGLEPGERVCISQLDGEVAGMRVRTVESTEDPGDVVTPPPPREVATADAPPATPNPERPRPDPGRLLQAAITHGGATSEIRLRIAGDYETSTMRLTQPERFVIDLANVINHSPRSQVAAGDGPVERLRIAQFQTEPNPIARIVFDLRRQATPAITRTDEGLTIGFDSEDP